MREGEPAFESEEQTDAFGLTRERRMETVVTNVDLILRRCIRQGVQPRDVMLRAVQDRTALQERLGDSAGDVLRQIESLPDFDLDDPDGQVAAAQALQELYGEIVSRQFEDRESASALHERQDVKTRGNWNRAGLFSYELGENHALILHVPPMTEAPSPGKMKDSLHELAAVVREDPDITEVRGSSLLLEHPIAKRLGFTIDKESDHGFNPNFRMPRQEFLERFGGRV